MYMPPSLKKLLSEHVTSDIYLYSIMLLVFIFAFQGLTLYDLRMPLPLDFLYDVSTCTNNQTVFKMNESMFHVIETDL